uniref:Uncharacterized protein n=1 Tax=Bos mutus grunniens TaxID=30521 RepID=A0A8B9W3L5_BOSMU
EAIPQPERGCPGPLNASGSKDAVGRVRGSRGYGRDGTKGGEARGISQKLLGLVQVAQSDSGSTPGSQYRPGLGGDTQITPFQSRPRLPHPFLGANPSPSSPPPANSKPTGASPPPGSVHIPWVDTALHANCVSRSVPPRDVPTPLSRGLLTAHSTASDPAPPARPRPSEAPPRPSEAPPRPSEAPAGPVRPRLPSADPAPRSPWARCREAEFFALQDSNNKLAGALREANAAAAQWRQQLEAQRAEAERLRQRVAELEAQAAQSQLPSVRRRAQPVIGAAGGTSGNQRPGDPDAEEPD